MSEKEKKEKVKRGGDRRQNIRRLYERYYKTLFTKSFGFIFVLLLAYLFVSAPPELPDGKDIKGNLIPIEKVFEIIDAENARFRAVYTQEIVAKGKKNLGLKFGEDWKEEGVIAGPLPALFLREVSSYLEKRPEPLSLFLASDFPINPSNQLTGMQLDYFQKIKKTREPKFFYSKQFSRNYAMFPDLASVASCIDCHNSHSDSPKKDWKIDAVMGATTWGYPDSGISVAETINLIKVFRQGVKSSYGAYLNKLRKFKKIPKIGTKWPSDGNYLPSEEVFMKKVEREISYETIKKLF